MPVNPAIFIYHGTNPALLENQHNKSGLDVRYKLADNSDADLNNPIPIPSSGVNYSYPKHSKVHFLTTPNEFIQNLVWFVDDLGDTVDPALSWDGLTLWAGITTGYSQGVVGDATTLRPQLTDAENYTSASPLTVRSGIVIAAGETGPGLTQPYVLTQLAVLPAALSGVKARRDAWYRWEEI